MFYWSLVVQATSGEPGLIEGLCLKPFNESNANARVLDSPTAVYPVRILVQGMVLFNENLAQWVPTKKDGTPNKNGIQELISMFSFHRLIIYNSFAERVR